MTRHNNPLGCAPGGFSFFGMVISGNDGFADTRNVKLISRVVPIPDLHCGRGSKRQKPSRLRIECVEHRLRVFEIGRVELRGKPAVEGREQVAVSSCRACPLSRRARLTAASSSIERVENRVNRAAAVRRQGLASDGCAGFRSTFFSCARPRLLLAGSMR
jgi:hypothetical protein